MIARKHRQLLQEASQKLEKVCIFIEEDLHNCVFQEAAPRLELAVHKEEEYIAKGARICSSF